MFTVYIYVLDTMADWEIGYVTAELNSGRYFKQNAPEIAVKMVSVSKQPIKTMGGLTVTPDSVIDEIKMDKSSVLILPGADTWNDPKHNEIVKKACELHSIGAVVCAICGATVALANVGLLNNIRHTSNGVGFLDMMSPNYKGQDFYVDEPSVVDGNLITAGTTFALSWAKQIIKCLEVFEENTLEAWYNFFSTGEAKYFFALYEKQY